MLYCSRTERLLLLFFDLRKAWGKPVDVLISVITAGTTTVGGEVTAGVVELAAEELELLIGLGGSASYLNGLEVLFTHKKRLCIKTSYQKL